MVPVLPKAMILGSEQKMHVEQHVAALTAALAMTPIDDERHGELTLTTVTKMTLVLPSRDAGELANEAKGEAYMAALEDVPSWAVQEAMRKWHRKECGPKFDYIWQPGPSTLRGIAMAEVYRVMAVCRRLKEIVAAEPLREFTAEHEASMRAKLAQYVTLNRA